MKPFAYHNNDSAVRRIAMIISLVVQTIMVPVLVYMLINLMKEKHGIYSLILVICRIACTVDSHFVFFSKGAMKCKTLHVVLQVIGSISGIALLIPVVYMLFFVIWLEQAIDYKLLFVVLAEEITYFTCNVLSYELIDEAEDPKYMFLPQGAYYPYSPANFNFSPLYPTLGMQYGGVPFQMNVVPNSTPFPQYNEGIRSCN